MRCNHCGEDIKKSGEVWVADLTLEDKAFTIRQNGFTLDQYRYYSMFCGFNDEGHLHQPSEVEIAKLIIDGYRRTNKNRPTR